ncbi:MAG: hypothetical protein ABI041_00120 [Bdellovibrionia bacterium]
MPTLVPSSLGIGWRKVPSLEWDVTVLDGQLAEEVMLDLNKDEVKAFVRFDYSSKENDPEGRSFDFLKASTFLE